MTGKEFEQKIQQASKEQGILAIRLRDAGYQGEATTQRRFTIKNVCDFILFDGLQFVALEAKHRKKALAFKDITQYKDMRKLEDFIEDNGMLSATCGLLVCFGSLDAVYWIHLSAIEEPKQDTGKKSFNQKDCEKMMDDLQGLIVKVDTVTPPRKRTPRLDMTFMQRVI